MYIIDVTTMGNKFTELWAKLALVLFENKSILKLGKIFIIIKFLSYKDMKLDNMEIKINLKIIFIFYLYLYFFL